MAKTDLKYKILLPLFLLILCVWQSSIAQSFKIVSPDKSTIFELNTTSSKQMVYGISFNKQPLLTASPLGLEVKQWTGALNNIMVNPGRVTQVNEIFPWPVGENKEISNKYSGQFFEVMASGKKLYEVEIRVFNGSAAFRYRLNNADTLTILKETTGFNFSKPQTIFRYEQESVFRPTALSSLADSCDFPTTLKSALGYISIAEANNINYNKAVLRKGEAGDALKMAFFKDKVVNATPYFITPWRTVSFATTAIGLLKYNDLLLKLCDVKYSAAQNNWIKPGKIFRSNLTDNDARLSIDFAVAHNFQYVLFDAGWYGSEFRTTSNPKVFIPAINIPQVITYAKKKNIGVFLYVNYVGLKAHLDSILPLYKKWGVTGLKFGFVDGLTQNGLSWLNQALDKTYKAGFLVNIHDNYKPTGLSRTYPNLLTQEGIRGNEHGGSALHNVTLPFTRFLAGPGDFTIGYLNSSRALSARYAKLGFDVSKGHQLALSVIFFSPLQTLLWYGKPEDYKNEKELEFFTKVPTVWDETQALQGQIGENIAIARRNGDSWYMGCATGTTAWNSSQKLSFLKPGVTYKATIYQDDKLESIMTRTIQVNKDDNFTWDIKPCGGQTIIFTPQSK
ncbi:glycoside hydrolase family 97 catalytic domain-containing protein [Mucilaginibacter terrae]|uniref:glycoside hydrolase family 97 protein n=1 Tax=Mucilaginibacter terrae TaxID=1955052 RepID=UPI0036272796